MKPRPGKVVPVLGLLLLLLLLLLSLSSSDVLALTLPPPPDTSASANNQNGPLPSPDQRSFAGGVLLVKDGSSNENVSTNDERVIQYFCSSGSNSVTKQYPTAIGESIAGPISSDQASGIIQAMAAVRPPKTVPLSIFVPGLAFGFGNLTYALTAVTYNVTTYSVWVTTQGAQASEQRVGYIVVGIPEHPQLKRLFDDFGGADCPNFSYTEVGPAFRTDPFAWVYQPLIPTNPPDGGLAPIITYGNVRVLSAGKVVGAAAIRPGENATFMLPPGTYSAVADVSLLGIPLSVGTGTLSSPATGGNAQQLTVWLTNVEYLWYGFEILAIIIALAVAWVVARRVGILSVLTQSPARGSSKLAHAREGGDYHH